MTDAERLLDLARIHRGCAVATGVDPNTPFVVACEAGARALEVLALAEGSLPLPVASGKYETFNAQDETYWYGIAGPAAVDRPSDKEARQALLGRLMATVLEMLKDEEPAGR